MPEWRNWQTRTTQNRVSYALVGSIPTSGISFFLANIVTNATIITFFIMMC